MNTTQMHQADKRWVPMQSEQGGKSCETQGSNQELTVMVCQ